MRKHKIVNRVLRDQVNDDVYRSDLQYLRKYMEKRDVAVFQSIEYPTIDPIINRLYEIVKCCDDELYFQSTLTLFSLIDSMYTDKFVRDRFHQFFKSDVFVSLFKQIMNNLFLNTDAYEFEPDVLANVFYKTCRNNAMHSAIFSDDRNIFDIGRKRNDNNYKDNELKGRFLWHDIECDGLFIVITQSGGMGSLTNDNEYYFDKHSPLNLNISYVELIQLLTCSIIDTLNSYSSADYMVICRRLVTDIERYALIKRE